MFTLMVNHLQAKRTKKAGIVGKYGTRYGSSLRSECLHDQPDSNLNIPSYSKWTVLLCAGMLWGSMNLLVLR